MPPLKVFVAILFSVAMTIESASAFLVQPACRNILHRHGTLCAHAFDGEIDVERTNSMNESTCNTTTCHQIKYHIHNRMNLSSQQAAPILVLHGGPGIPSDYLLPLCDAIPYRSIVFYDQLGCGRSSGPDFNDAYSIDSSLDDLELLIKKIGLRRFHLYGQSFGGILAFEYMKRMSERKNDNDDAPVCLSAILSSSPCDVDQVESVAGDLIEKLLKGDPDESTVMERFRLKYTCRRDEKPQPLIDAYEGAGATGVWRGTESIRGWKATKPAESSNRMPSCMVMRGEHDFVTADCVEGWKDAFNHKFVRMKELEKLSHHGLLEDENMYGEIVDSFFSEYD